MVNRMDIKREYKLGLIGEKLSHSLSPEIHRVIFDEIGVKGSYVLMETETEGIENLVDAVRNDEILGVNITVPYKEEVIKYLDSMDDKVKLCRSCNTLRKENDGRIKGFNTDWKGLEKLLEKNGIDCLNKKILILGYGGVAKMAEKYFESKGCLVTIVSRKVYDNKANSQVIFSTYDDLLDFDFDIVVNATPLGMGEKRDMNPLDLIKEDIEYKILKRAEAFVDFIYNPFETLFLKKGKENGIKAVNGLDMLIYQAIYAEMLWINHDFPENLVENLYDRIKSRIFRKPILLIGAPGSGKTTLLNLLKQRLSEKENSIFKTDNYFIDLDVEIEKREGKSIPEIFRLSEDAFRRMESELLREYGNSELFRFVSGGGGVIKSPSNREFIKERYTTIFIDRPIENIIKDIDLKNRPLLGSIEDLRRIYNGRYDLYRNNADFIIKNNEDAKTCVNKILEILEL